MEIKESHVRLLVDLLNETPSKSGKSANTVHFIPDRAVLRDVE